MQKYETYNRMQVQGMRPFCIQPCRPMEKQLFRSVPFPPIRNAVGIALLSWFPANNCCSWVASLSLEPGGNWNLDFGKPIPPPQATAARCSSFQQHWTLSILLSGSLIMSDARSRVTWIVNVIDNYRKYQMFSLFCAKLKNCVCFSCFWINLSFSGSGALTNDK